MASRLLQIYLPRGADPEAEGVLEEADVLASWKEPANDGDSGAVLHMLFPTEETESVMDRFEAAYGEREGFAVVLLAVEASLPRPDPNKEEESDQEASDDGEEEADRARDAGRVSREELYTEVTRSIGSGRSFHALVGLSAVVAAAGLMKDDLAVIIGAMVIAPLLGPNVAMSLAATLGDEPLLKRALRANLIGLAIALAISLAFGLLIPFDPTVEAIARRTEFGPLDLVLSLAAGSAGTFAFTSGVAGALIGVMVAVALVPPLVAGGMLLGSGETTAATGAFLLATANMICINLAGVGTFLLQGVGPRTWWEEEKARRMTRRAVALWLTLIGLLIGAFLLRTYLGPGG